MSPESYVELWNHRIVHLKLMEDHGNYTGIQIKTKQKEYVCWSLMETEDLTSVRGWWESGS